MGIVAIRKSIPAKKLIQIPGVTYPDAQYTLIEASAGNTYVMIVRGMLENIKEI